VAVKRRTPTVAAAAESGCWPINRGNMLGVEHAPFVTL
jgi:hypothetical protein